MSRWILLFAALLSAERVFSQDWYEIEVLVFEHTNNFYGSADPERWPSNIDLAWPSPLIKLGHEPLNQYPLDQELGNTEDHNTGGHDTDIAPPETDSDHQKPFTPFSPEQRRLKNSSYALRNRNGYRVLWHEAWKAPMLSEDSAPWILVQAEELLDGHFRLEGALRIHLGRYLHLSTDLWVTELQARSRSSEQTGFHWSQLPSLKTPQQPCSFIALDWPADKQLGARDHYDNNAAPGWYYPYGCNVSEEKALRAAQLAEQEFLNRGSLSSPDLPQSFPAQEGFPVQDDLNDALAPTPLPQVRLSPSAPRFGQDSTAVEVLENNQTEHQPTERIYNEATGRYEIRGSYQATAAYPVEHIIHINSKRRMRSKELHYVDHPKIGILVIAHPVEKPKIEEKPIEYIPAPLPTPGT